MTTTAVTARVASATALDLEPLGPGFGAVIHDLDLSSVSGGQVVALQQALVRHKVLFFREQALTDQKQVLLGSRLGDLALGHPTVGGVPGQPHIQLVDCARPEAAVPGDWHADATFVEQPPAVSILRAVRLPGVGGDTSWADSQLAYDSLSAPVRRLADELAAVHDGNRESIGRLRRGLSGVEHDARSVADLPPVTHPVVRVHPETGRRGLFVNPGYTSHVVGVSEAESRGILDLLYAHLTRPEHTVRHRWAAGDVVIWDNRSTSHYADPDHTRTRVLHRVSVRGDRPYGPARSALLTPRLASTGTASAESVPSSHDGGSFTWIDLAEGEVA